MKKDRVDVDLLAEQLKAIGVDDPAGVAEKLRPSIATLIAREDRRRREGMRLAHREGFLTGKAGAKSMPYHSQLWTASNLYQRMFGDKERDAALQERYSRYNDD